MHEAIIAGSQLRTNDRQNPQINEIDLVAIKWFLSF